MKRILVLFFLCCLFFGCKCQIEYSSTALNEKEKSTGEYTVEIIWERGLNIPETFQCDYWMTSDFKICLYKYKINMIDGYAETRIFMLRDIRSITIRRGK